MNLLAYTDIQFYFFFIYFIVAVFFAFFVPGFLIFSRYEITFFQKIIISTIYGIVLWGLQALILSYLHLQWLTYFYLLFCCILFCFILQKKKKRLEFLNKSFKSLVIFLQKNKLIFTLLVLGIISQYSSIWLMGIHTAEGLVFCCRSVPDNLYHLALTNSLLQSFPPQEPGMAGQLVHNYYYGTHSMIADLVRVFYLPLITTQGNFIPLLLSILFGCSIIVFSQFYKLSKTFTSFALFFLYFHSDIFYLMRFFTTGIWDVSTGFVDTGINLVTVPPLAFGIVFFFCTLLLLHLWIERKDFKTGFIISLVVAFLVSIKIYIAVFTLIGFFFVSFYCVIKSRNLRFVLPFFISVLIALGLYIPINSGAGGLFFSGVWRLTDFAAQPTLGLLNFALALQVYQVHNNILRIALVEIVLFLLYMTTLFGSLLVGFFQTKQTIRIFPTWLHVFLIPAAIITLCLGLFTLQKTGGANTIQFIIFLFFVFSLYAALSTSWIFSRIPKGASLFLLIFLLALSLPRIVTDLSNNYLYSVKRERVVVSTDMLDAIEKLKHITSEKDIIAVDENYLADTFYFLPLLTNRKIYLTGTGILEDHGISYQRHDKFIHAFSANQLSITSEQLKKEGITYLFVKHARSSSMQFVDGTSEIDIYRVK